MGAGCVSLVALYPRPSCRRGVRCEGGLIAGLFAVWRVELGCYGSFGNVVVVQGWMLAWGGESAWLAQEAPNHAPYIKTTGLPIASNAH